MKIIQICTLSLSASICFSSRCIMFVLFRTNTSILSTYDSYVLVLLNCWIFLCVNLSGNLIFLSSATDFINVATDDGGVIATINLQSFMHAKDLSTIDISLSDNGARLCILYGDGSVSVVDRNVYLRENPKRRFWAFQYTADDGRETPSSVVASYEKPARLFSISPEQSRSPSVVSNADLLEETVPETLSLAGLDRKDLPRSASATTKYLPDVVPVWRGSGHQGDVAGSCPVLSPKSAFFRVESYSSIDEEEPPTLSPVCLRVASPRISDTADYSVPFSVHSGPGLGVSQSLAQSQTCPTLSSPPTVTDPNQEKAACCYFQIPFWTDRARCRKLVWTSSRLFLWLSVHNALSREEHIVILFSLSSEKVFSYRSVVDLDVSQIRFRESSNACSAKMFPKVIRLRIETLKALPGNLGRGFPLSS